MFATFQTVSSSAEVTEDVVLSTISRVLSVSWTDRSEATVFLPHTAEAMKEARQEDPAMPVNVQVQGTSLSLTIMQELFF